MDSAFALYGFDDNGGGLVVDDGFGGIEVAVGNEFDAGHEGFKWLAVFLSSSGGEGANSFAVVSADGRDNFAAFGGCFGEFQGRFDGFGA